MNSLVKESLQGTCTASISDLTNMLFVCQKWSHMGEISCKKIVEYILHLIQIIRRPHTNLPILLLLIRPYDEVIHHTMKFCNAKIQEVGGLHILFPGETVLVCRCLSVTHLSTPRIGFILKSFAGGSSAEFVSLTFNFYPQACLRDFVAYCCDISVLGI